MINAKHKQEEFIEIYEQVKTNREAGGFGHTGKH
jgi:dUTPase